MTRLTKAQIAANNEAEIKAAQQAELKRLRAEKAAKTRAANKAAKHAETVQPEAMHTNTDTMFDDVDALLGSLPTPRRVMVGFLLTIAVSGLVGYGFGMVLSYLVAGIMVLTSTAWIAFVLTALVWIIGLYAGWHLGGYIGGKVFASVVLPDGLASRSYESIANALTPAGVALGNAKSRVLGMFKRSEVDEFTGAFTA